MRKTLLLSALLLGAFFYSNAQVYTGAVGLGLDLGDGFTFVGPSGKYFFAENHAGQFDLGFDDGATALTFLYSYHSEFDGADGLQINRPLESNADAEDIRTAWSNSYLQSGQRGPLHAYSMLE